MECCLAFERRQKKLTFYVHCGFDAHRLLADSWVSWESKGTTHTAEERGPLGWTRWTARGLRRVCWIANILESELKIVVSQTGKKKKPSCRLDSAWLTEEKKRDGSQPTI